MSKMELFEKAEAIVEMLMSSLGDWRYIEIPYLPENLVDVKKAYDLANELAGDLNKELETDEIKIGYSAKVLIDRISSEYEREIRQLKERIDLLERAQTCNVLHVYPSNGPVYPSDWGGVEKQEDEKEKKEE